MPKKSASYELVLPSRNGDMPAYQWLYEGMRDEILGGRLRPGTRLPATRDLARQYRLSRGTIVSAFDQLASEGYIQGSVGSGTYVSGVLPEKLLHAGSGQARVTPVPNSRRVKLSDYGGRAKLFQYYEKRPIRAFRANLPALDLFPMAVWTQITTRCLRRISTRNLMGCDASGYGPLRLAIADYLGRARGVRCSPEQVVIVSGLQEAIDLTARLLVNPDDQVYVENPGYPGATLTFEAYGAKPLPAEMDVDGIIVQKLPPRGVRLIYVTPGHQFPLGTTMSIARRLELLDWARKSRAVILEDDYDSEYRYSGRPIPALQGLDENTTVIYAGSFSKVLFPALRIGYLVAPHVLIDRYEAALSLTVRHAPLLEQLVLTDFLCAGHFGRHLRRMREVYAERLAVLLEESRSKLAGLMEISEVQAGLQTVGWLSEGTNEEDVVSAAAARNVDVTPLSQYSQARIGRSGLQLGFAALGPKEIRRGVRELAIALEGASRA